MRLGWIAVPLLTGGDAAAGLARVLGTRGPDVNIRRGDLVEMALDREIRFEESDVR